uniref:Uncharacterized protein n=1 Tax=Sphaerodactylus townsendi TaxID=933632 RepID=A0ACB8ELQ7_9SAUR
MITAAAAGLIFGLSVGPFPAPLEKSVRRLREKFYGKVTIRDAVILMRMFNNDHDLACQRIIERKNEMGDIDLEDDPDLASDLVALELIERLQEEEEQRQQVTDGGDGQ